MKPKKEKIIPIVIASREAMEATVADIVRLKLAFQKLAVQMEQDIAEVQRKYQTQMLNLSQQIDAKEASAQAWCQKNKKEFGDKRSIDFLLATVGFRTTPPRVEKAHSKDTWTKIALRLQALDWGIEYVSEPAPEVAKAKLLADRTKLTEDQLSQAGIRFDQDEDFFIEPKSEVLEPTVKEAA